MAIFADDYGLFQVAKMAFAVLSYEKNSQHYRPSVNSL